MIIKFVYGDFKSPPQWSGDEMNCNALAEKIIKYVGGRDNIISAVNCATRLRFLLKNENAANGEALSRTDGVLGVVCANGQYQVVVGNGADKVCRELNGILRPDGSGDNGTGNYGLNGIKHPLIALMVGGGVCGLLMGLAKVNINQEFKAVADIAAYCVRYAATGAAAAFLSGMVGIMIGRITNTDGKTEDKSLHYIIYAPLRGMAVPLNDVGDLAFSGEMLGKGAAIIPETNLLSAPCDGVVDYIPNAKNTVSMTADNGVRILMHIGIDTANLKGKYFTALVSEGDRVKMGEPLIEFDAKAVRDYGYDLTSPIVIENSSDFDRVAVTTEYAVEQQPFLELIACVMEDKPAELNP